MKKIGFVTCVQLGLSCMEEIDRIGGRLELLITLKDEKAQKKSGRVYLDEFALHRGIPLLKIDHINDGKAEQVIREMGLDWLLIIGWSQIAENRILSAPREGCIGMHPTLLPEGRGRASIPWAILKGLPETGVTMFRLNDGVDTGEILDQERILLHSGITATELYKKVNEAHVQLMQRNWKPLTGGTVRLRPQDERKATVWQGRRPEDGRITEQMRVEEALTLVRAVTHPYPGAFVEFRGRRWRIWSAERIPQEETEVRAIKAAGPKLGLPVLRLRDGFIRLLEYEVENE